MMKPLGDYALLYMYMCLHDHDYVVDFYFMMILRSITGPYGRPVIEVAYGEMIFLLHQDCMGDDSSGRVSAWCIAHVWHNRVNISVGTMYIIFWFSNIKAYVYVYVYCFQNLYVV